MTKLLILQGVPASGKSTYSKSLDPKVWTRVNRDDLRRMFGGYMEKNREAFVEYIEKRIITAALEDDRNVCVDDTNLNPGTIKIWKEIAEKYNAQIEFKEFKISLKEALERDAQREFPVGRKVIEGFFKKYYPNEYKEHFTDARLKDGSNEMEESKMDVVLCDLDGTIALHNGRNAFEYDKIHTDILNKRLDRILVQLDIPVIFLSGREGTDVAKKQTLEWLSKNGYGDCLLYMRNKGDYRPDEVIKKEIYETFIKPNYNVVTVFDDRDKVVKMWRELGLMCCQVNEGDF